MEKIQLAIDLWISGDDQAFIAYDKDNEWPEAVGVGRGIRYAAVNFVDNFNAAEYLDENDNVIVISCDDVIVPKHRHLTPHKVKPLKKLGD